MEAELLHHLGLSRARFPGISEVTSGTLGTRPAIIISFRLHDYQFQGDHVHRYSTRLTASELAELRAHPHYIRDDLDDTLHFFIFSNEEH